MGRLCHRCAPGYGRSGQNGCAKCPDRVFNLLLISGGAIAAFLIMGFLIYTTRKSAKNDKDLMMMMIKIFMSYIQFVSLAVGLEIDWPPALVSLFRAQQGASSVTELFISFDCALASPDGDPSSTGQAASSGGIELFYQTQILYVSSPVVCGCVGVWVRGCARRDVCPLRPCLAGVAGTSSCRSWGLASSARSGLACTCSGYSSGSTRCDAAPT